MPINSKYQQYWQSKNQQQLSMRKVAALNQQNGTHPTTKMKSSRNQDYQKLKYALAQALDENDNLRGRVCVLEALLTQSNHQNQMKDLRIAELERQLTHDFRRTRKSNNRLSCQDKRSFSR